ncbi:MAG: hypothetical protein KDJ39_18895 [Gammaproteobacteria bacterium]|nr:hypothetical protein [Gammaproteobacteria bacterium]
MGNPAEEQAIDELKTEGQGTPQGADESLSGDETPNGDSGQEGADGFDVVVDEEGMPPSDTVPLRAHLNSKAKWKGKLQKAEKSAEALAAENDLLRMQLQQTQGGGKRGTAPKMPTLEDCDYDEDEFRRRSVEYAKSVSVEEARRAAAEMIENSQRSAQLQSKDADTEAALDRHYTNAGKLKVDDFEAAEDRVIEIFGRDAAREIIANVEDSHLLMYWLGKNPDKASHYADLLKRSPVKGIFALGELRSKIKVQPRGKSSPSPDEAVEGAGVTGAQGWERRIDTMRDKVAAGKASMSDLMKLKRQAQQAGFNG